jgi:hypothetical protein
MGPPSYIWSVGDRNFVMRRITALSWNMSNDIGESYSHMSSGNELREWDMDGTA